MKKERKAMVGGLGRRLGRSLRTAGIIVVLTLTLVAFSVTPCLRLSAASSVVSLDGWGWQNPLPQANDLYAVWGNSNSNVFVVGNGGTILHYNGSVWSSMTGGTTQGFRGVWGNSPSDVFAVGTYGTIFHYNGSVWSAMSSGTIQELRGVWGSSSSDVFVVGNGGTILHYNGLAWSAMSSGTIQELCGIWGSSSSDVFAVGAYGTILHYNGSVWGAMSSGTTQHLRGIWGSSPSDVFAVGTYGTILHYNSSAWSATSSGTTGALYGVWGYFPSDVFAVGAGGIIIDYNGSVWSPMTSGTTRELYGIWGSSSSDVFAVGTYGTILHYNGLAWSAMSSGTTEGLLGIWGSSPSDVFAVGWHGTILHYNGLAWSAMSSGSTSLLYGIWGSSPSDVFAVGYSGTILHYNGSVWSAMSSGTTQTLLGIWGSSPSDVFAVGWGTILHYNGLAWSAMSSGSTSSLFGIWGSSPSDVFAVGNGGTILHYNGNTWSTMSSSTGFELHSVWGSSSSDVFAVGVVTILHYNGSAWSSMNSGAGLILQSVWGSSSADVFAVGDSGTILHYNGSVWSSMSSGTTSDLDAVWGSSNTDVFSAGSSGTILHYLEFAPPTMTSVTPSYGAPGKSLDVNIVGTYFTGATSIDFSTGVTVNSYTVRSSVQIVANLTINVAAALGARDVSVTTPGGVASLPDGFTVTTSQPPNQPTNSSPTNGAGSVALSPILQSSAFSDPDAGDTHAASQWQISSTTGDYSSPVLDSGTDTSHLTSIAILSGELQTATTYYWRARYQDNNRLWSPWSAETSFTTASSSSGPPNQPTNAWPAAGATDIAVDLTLQSSAFSDLDSGDTHAVSQWQMTATSGDYSSPMFDSGVDSSNLTSIAIPLGKLQPATTYYWRVRHQDNHGKWSDWSAETSFTTASSLNAPPNRPTNVFPTNGATDITSNPTVVSSAFSDPDLGDTHAASQWQVRFGPSDYYTYTDVSNLTSIPVPSGILSLNTTYYWRVRHQDNHGNWSDWSSETSFTTEAILHQPPAQPSNVSPADGDTNVRLRPTLSSSAFSDPDTGDTHAASQWQITTSTGDYSSPVFDGGRDVSNLIQLSVPSGVLNASTTFYWRVRHQDNHGNWSDYSTETSFTTGSDGEGSTSKNRSFLFYVIGGACGGVALIGVSTGYLWRRRKLAAIMAPYRQQLKQWGDEGYDVSDFKRKWLD